MKPFQQDNSVGLSLFPPSIINRVQPASSRSKQSPTTNPSQSTTSLGFKTGHAMMFMSELSGASASKRPFFHKHLIYKNPNPVTTSQFNRTLLPVTSPLMSPFTAVPRIRLNISPRINPKMVNLAYMSDFHCLMV